MNKILPNSLIVILTLIFLFSGCRKKEFDEFYGRPENLGAPIYQQLQQRGNFTKFLECVDKSGYKETLSAAGSWTVFAPNDAAFAAYMAENNLTTISQEQASAIVRYSMTYDGEKIEQLSDNLTGRGFVKNTAFRRRTVFYDFVYDGADANGNPIKVISANRNGSFISSDFNNINIPFFLPPFLNFSGVNAFDYNYFFPNSEFVRKNVAGAKIIEEDIIAENGVIHVIDKVLTPPQSIDQYINTNNNYSFFKSLLDRYVTYNVNADISRRYQVLTGKPDNVFVKNYSNILAFSPNNENYLRLDANDAQIGMYAIFAPTNAAVESYSRVLLKYYANTLRPGTFREQLNELFVVRPDIINNFVNSHFYNLAVWPSKFSTTNNFQGEPSKLSMANVVDKQFLSNGLFYGVNTAQNANVFSTVYGNINLDPRFRIMTQALDFYGFSLPTRVPTIRYAIIPISDATLNSLGITFDPFFAADPIRFNPAISSLANTSAFRRLLQTHLIPLGSRAVPDFATSSGILEASNGEFIKFDRGTFSSVGTEERVVVADRRVNIDSVATALNGSAAYVSSPLAFSTTNVGRHIERNGTLATDPYFAFFQFLRNNALIYNSSNGAISGVNEGSFYTVFVPTNAAIQAAVTAGVLPRLANGTPNFNPTLPNEISMVVRFIQYHIISGSVASDGQKTGSFETLLRNAAGDPFRLTVTANTTTTLTLRDIQNTTTNVLLGPTDRSNVLSNRTVIHQINTYLKF
jgi:uncharacterized surface protein with fasciclin (FAS1) repeats